MFQVEATLLINVQKITYNDKIGTIKLVFYRRGLLEAELNHSCPAGPKNS